MPADKPLRVARSARLKHSPAELWPILSATDRLNRESDLPYVEYQPIAQKRGGTQLIAQAKFMGMRMKWDELPYEWIEPVIWRVTRLFHSGPMKSGVFGCDLVPHPDGTTEVTYSCDYVPANFIGGIIAPRILTGGLDKMIQIAKNADAFLDKKSPTAFIRRYKTASINHGALSGALKILAELHADDALSNKLAEDICHLPDEELVRMRPFEVAERWSENPRKVLTLFMRAVRAGLLDLSWQTICPHCRGAQHSVGSLKQIRSKARCDFCNVDFTTEFDRSIEARFTVNPSIRVAPDRHYCIGGPGKTPHIRAQIRVNPGEKRELMLPVKPGQYRLRSPQIKNAVAINIGASAGPVLVENLPALKVSIREFDFEPLEADYPSSPVRIEVTSKSDGPVDLKFEHADWNDRAATAAVVTAMPEFYDLAQKDALLPDEELAVKSVALLFSDLRGSTSLYKQLGDAGAYALVREHFKVMEEVLMNNGGGIVKTIGDAVMAVFTSPPDALRACFEIQRAFIQLWEKRPQMATIVVKLGFHCGPCIVVRPHNRIDYFGTTVNIAARVQGESKGGDIVLLESVYNLPAMQEVLSHYTYSVEKYRAQLKGLGEQNTLVRVLPDWGGKHLPEGTRIISRNVM